MTFRPEAEAVELLAQSLVRASKEHGTPNSFSPAELVGLYDCPLSCKRIGRLARSCARLLYERMAVAGLHVHYENRRFALLATR